MDSYLELLHCGSSLLVHRVSRLASSHFSTGLFRSLFISHQLFLHLAAYAARVVQVAERIISAEGCTRPLKKKGASVKSHVVIYLQDSGHLAEVSVNSALVGCSSQLPPRTKCSCEVSSHLRRPFETDQLLGMLLSSGCLSTIPTSISVVLLSHREETWFYAHITSLNGVNSHWELMMWPSRTVYTINLRKIDR